MSKDERTVTFVYQENTKATHHQPDVTNVLQTPIQIKLNKINAKIVMIQQDPMPVLRSVLNVKKVIICQIQLEHVQHVQPVTPVFMDNLNAANVD